MRAAIVVMVGFLAGVNDIPDRRWPLTDRFVDDAPQLSTKV
jgi:hypothetical protein